MWRFWFKSMYRYQKGGGYLQMAHSRKDTFTKPLQWWKHLRDWKRFQNKKERRAAKTNIKKDTD